MSSAGSTLEQLRALLHEPPSPACWDDLVAALDRERDDEVAALALAYATPALDATWPDTLRVAPRRWWRAALAGQPAPAWPMARALELDASEALHDALRSPLTQTLTTLRLGPDPIPHRALRALLTGAALHTLHTLDAAHAPWFGPAELDTLAALTDWSALRTLRLSGASLTLPLVRALTTSRFTQRATDRPHLDALHLEGAPTDPQALPTLWEELEHIPHLLLHRVGLDDRLAHTLATRRASPRGLLALDLSHNPLQGALLPLATAPWLAHLEALDLRDASLAWRDLRALTRPRHVLGLRRLALDANALEDEGIAQLAALSLPALRDLSLKNTRLTDRGADALLAAPWLHTLERLDLSDNPLSPNHPLHLTRTSR